MSVFGEYSDVYDLLYADKDYAAEVAYVDTLLRAHVRAPASLLELGCGTGHHAVQFARRGYAVHGVDLSARMLEHARLRTSGMPNLTFEAGDARAVRVGRSFDAVVSLFHVIDYQQTHADLAAMVTTARVHLNAGGAFVFDCWYGPGVLTDPPQPRLKHVKNASLEVFRMAQPLMDVNANTVDVNYQLLVRREGGALQHLRETHTMRYLFQPEVKTLLEQGGFAMRVFEPWLTGGTCTAATWSAAVVAIAV